MNVSAHFPPFDQIAPLTHEGRILRRPITSRQQRELEKVAADLHVAAVALDAAITRVQSERLNVREASLWNMLMQCGEMRLQIESVLSQCRDADSASAEARRLAAIQYGT